ncbi:hypothetical protein ACFV27_25320 [Streptomyces antimycoticus]|uniref:hypothetical protein n=1 Tax=Streptomyces antimycoticus TaxID=68175 RepID=UPI0036870E06
MSSINNSSNRGGSRLGVLWILTAARDEGPNSVRRHAFLEVHPGQEKVIGKVKYLAISGSRFLAAARAASLTSLRIEFNDSLANLRLMLDFTVCRTY